MNIVKLQINNYRLLKEIEIDVEKDLSLIIGKNNCGKTSVLSVLSKFIGDQSTTNSFNYDDFNIEFQNKLFKYIENSETDWELERIKGIELYIYIEYTDEDNLANLSSLMLDLDPNNKVIVLKLEYTIDKRSILTLVDSFDKYYLRFKKDRKNKLSKRECFENYMHSKSRQYFKIVYKTILFDINKKELCHEIFRIIEKKKLDLGRIISIKSIAAKRETVNKDNDGTLSNLSSRYYERIKGDEENQVFQEFEDALIDTDISLTEVYQGLFEDVMNKVKKFGGIKENETIVKIISTLRQQQLLKDNTTVVYETEKHHLPESYNGLGYLNLISIIIQIETILSEFRNDKDKSVSPADINLLFIEEPEAHTHPQMQYVFMKNIKNLLKEGSLGGDGRNKINLQTIITTHSSHIVSECEIGRAHV